MATLEKIRSKSILLIVIIGVALIAFIIGDFLNSGRSMFGTGTTVAKVDGEKLDIIDYQRRLEQQNALYQQQGRKIDDAQLQQQVLDAMVSEKLFEKEMKALGLEVTDAELADIMLGRGAQVLSQRVAQDSQGQITSIAELHNMITRPAEYGLPQEQVNNLRNYWQQIEEETATQIRQQKFMTLFNGTLVANELDAKAFYDENATPSQMAFVKKDYSLLSNDDYEVTDDDINREWAKNKNAYKLNGEMRNVSYLSVAIVPSADDLLQGQKRVEEAMLKLQTAEGTEVLADMNDFVVDSRHLPAASVTERDVKAFLDSASIGQAKVVSHNANAYTIVKLLAKASETDSVNIDFLAVQGKAQLDSILTALNGGAKFADVVSNPAVVSSQDSVWVSLAAANGAQLRSVLADRPAGVFFTADTAANAQGGAIYRINVRRAPVQVYDYAYITYTVDPSEATVNKLEADLQQFLNENPKAETFMTNAVEAGYQVFPDKIMDASYRLGNLEDTRGPVVWAMEAKKGQVSPIFETAQNTRLVAVAVNDIYDDYIPARDPQVKEYLTVKVRGEKKGDALMAQYNGKAKDLAGYAQLLGSKIDTTRISFGQVMVPSIGMNEGELQARAALAEPHKLQGPVKGNTALVVFEIVGQDTATRPYDFNEASQTFNGNRGAYRLSNMMPQILLGNKKVKNNLSKFYHSQK